MLAFDMSFVYRKLDIEGISFDEVKLIKQTTYLTMVNCLGNLAVIYMADKKLYFSSQKCAQSPTVNSASTGFTVFVK